MMDLALRRTPGGFAFAIRDHAAIWAGIALAAAFDVPVFAQAAAVDETSRIVGSINVSASASGGTQRKNDVSGELVLSRNSGPSSSEIRRQLRFRAEGAYSVGQKPAQAKVVSTEWFFSEARYEVYLGHLFKRDGETGETGVHVRAYGLGSVFHQIAFDLDSEQTAGAGLSFDLLSVPGLAVATDLRYIREEFDSQDDFDSWAVRVHQSYDRSWTIVRVNPDDPAGKPESRTFIFAEAIEIIPAFKSADATQVRASAQFVIPIVPRWSMSVRFGSDYMRNVPPNFKRLFWKTSVGLTHSFPG